MLIQAASDPRQQRSAELRWKADDRYLIGWAGNLYRPGHAAGEATIDHLLGELDQRDIADIAGELRGIYGLFLFDRSAAMWSILCDNAGLYKIFYNADGVATRFLELLDAGEESPSVDDQAVVEFLAHGCIFGERTPIHGIRKLRRGEILECRLGDAPFVRRAARSVSAPTVPDDHAFLLDYFDDFAAAIAGHAVSVDLTGGFDTRLIACMLERNGLDFECAITGMPGTSDVKTAERIAATLDRALRFHPHDISGLEEELPALFAMSDGLMSIKGLHRAHALCHARRARVIDLMVHGGGGECLRDNRFVQDFPRYGARAVDFRKYYDLRVAPVKIPDNHLTPHGRSLLEAVRNDTLARFSELRCPTNNLTYEKIYYEYRAPEFYGILFSSYINSGLEVEAPFLDYRINYMATKVSPWRRTFMMWPRRLITRHCPKLARLPTADGYTASSHPGRLILELGNHVRVQAGRVGRKLAERHLGRAMFHRVGALQADHPDYAKRLRESAFYLEAFERLKTAGLLDPGLDPEHVRATHVGRVMTMGALLGRLDTHVRTQRRPAPSSAPSALP